MIPRLIAITPPGFFARPDCQSVILQILGAGRVAIMLRDKSDLTDDIFFQQCHWVRPLTQTCGSLLIVNRRLELARSLDADGIHLGANGPTIADARDALGDRVIIGWSAHSFEEALDAFRKGADYVTLSPIYETPNKGRPLGLEPLRNLAIQKRPVIALGGVTPDRVRDVIDAGAHGVAAIRAIFDNPDPAAAVKSLMRNIGSN